MIRRVFTLPPTLPVSRVLATQLAQTAGKFSSRIMIENEQKIVNGKSLLGLLSLYDALDKPLQRALRYRQKLRCLRPCYQLHLVPPSEYLSVSAA